MSTFVDAMLVRLSTADGLRRLVLPDGDTGRTRIRALLAEVYDLPFADIHDVLDVTVTGVTCQHPLFAAVRRTGNWLQTIPTSTRTDFTVEGAADQPRWIDLVAELTVTAVLAVDPGGVESLTIGDIGEFATLAEFRAKFAHLDLDEFMARHGLSTVDELREAFRYQVGEVRLKPVPPFDPADPGNQRPFPLTVAVLIRDVLDLAGALRDVRLVAADRSGFPRQVDVAEATASHAPLLILPTGSTDGSGLTPEQVTDFLTGQRVLAVFEQL